MITNPKPTSTFTPSRWRRVFCLLFLGIAAATGIGAIASSRAVSRGAAAALAVPASPPTGDNLHFGQTRQTGVVFHMMSGLGELGRMGLTAVGNSHEEARATYDRAVAVLDEETPDGASD
jgi:hypothetical protein